MEPLLQTVSHSEQAPSGAPPSIVPGLGLIGSARALAPSGSGGQATGGAATSIVVVVAVFLSGTALASSVSQRPQVVPEAVGQGRHGVVALQLRRLDVDDAEYS